MNEHCPNLCGEDIMRKFSEVNGSQRSSAWFLARCGRPRISAGAMLARIKTGEAAALRDLRTTRANN